MSSLHIGHLRHGKEFTLPVDLVTSTQAILARKRSGKSYTASVEAEELLEAKQQVVAIDPTSAWWGLRSSANGEGEGYPIVVFGGQHQDAPLDFRAGKAMAAAVVEHGFSAIFDIGALHTEEQVQFVMDFCSELLRINPNRAIHVFMDEADTFAPQKPLGLLQNKCLGTVSRLVKQGGIRGVGFTMITQRPASMNKDVLSQVDLLTVLRMSHPLDLRAATDWIKSEVSAPFAKEVEAALPSLPVGTAFFCSAPLQIGERVAVRERSTFNSGATPKPGERKIEPKVLAKVDIEKLGHAISESVKRAQQDSPEYLKRKVAELEAQIARGGANSMGLTEEIQQMEAELTELRPLRGVQAKHDALVATMLSAGEHLSEVSASLNGLSKDFLRAINYQPAPLDPVTQAFAKQLLDIASYGETIDVYKPDPLPSVDNGNSPTLSNRDNLGRPDGSSHDGQRPSVKAGARRMLAACATMFPKGCTEAQVATQSQVKRTGGTFADYKSQLRTAGYIVIRDGRWYATEAGLHAVGHEMHASPKNTADVLSIWSPKLKGKSRDILHLLIQYKGKWVSYDTIADSVALEKSGGTFNDYLSLLRTVDLIVTERGHARANAETLLLNQ